jgi:hypothetical protein
VEKETKGKKYSKKEKLSSLLFSSLSNFGIKRGKRKVALSFLFLEEREREREEAFK